MAPFKSDADAIRACLGRLETQAWLGGDRASWPRYLFHVTDIRNAASILASGHLLSRAAAQQLGVMRTDNASPDIISRTSRIVLDYVRLYFRPRTPTFFLNEGIRPLNARQLGSHCPVPVALLFDSSEILTRSDAKFSGGNLAKRPILLSRSDDLKKIPFELVYHNRAIHQADDRDEIIFRRHAEVVIPQELSLESLRVVAVRSPAELKTLHTLLQQEHLPHIDTWSPTFEMARVMASVFHCQWTFIEDIQRDEDTILVSFNRDTKTPGPFNATTRWTNDAGAVQERVDPINAVGSYRIAVPDYLKGAPLTLEIWLDDSLGYRGRMTPGRTSLIGA